ncbi:LPS export ABC transporter permease LptG [Denitrificimonas sp. JX-1]|uniref:LPS export ABC transporter permease LptG n=1 Tax=Denitrificimonas halotolerans TaxID=3098930 RepID=A0ABU5GQT7_9GAMM|nr:LPS export ABC transporter permease LptG [Denitrificimonas sp. JX-1]MDY7218982.1 LPS export ABC transporter permease LptG [Denitrificimonas sp. JX-1]
MRRLDRHIGSTVFLAIVAVLGVISALALLFAFIDELNDVEGAYTLWDAASYVGFTAPQRIYEMLPMAALIGCLVGLGALASNSELTVMRAAGVSIRRIVWAVMKPMLVLMVLGVLVGEYLAPWASSAGEANRSLVQSVGKAQSSKRGLWHRQGSEYIHVNTVQPGGKLIGVTRYVIDDEQRLLQSSFAREGLYQNDHWLLEDIVYTDLQARSSSVRQAQSERWDVEITPDLLNTVVMDPDTLPISGLWQYANYLGEQGLNASRYWLAFWVKVLQPLVTAALVLLAISFVFGPLRSVTLGQRVFTGVLVGFIFRIAQDLLGPASVVFGFAPILAVVLPALICAGLGFWLLRRAG